MVIWTHHSRADTNNYELDQKEFSFENTFRGLIEDNHWLTEQLEKNPDFVIKYEDLDGIENIKCVRNY